MCNTSRAVSTKENAYELKKQKGCIFFEQKDFNEISLSKKLCMAFSSEFILRDMSRNSRSIYIKNASKNIIQLVLTIKKGNKK